jgi:hypothetical protein
MEFLEYKLVLFRHHRKIVFSLGIIFSFLLGLDQMDGYSFCMFRSTAESNIEEGTKQTSRNFQECTERAMKLPVQEQEQAKAKCAEVMNTLLKAIYSGRTSGDNVIFKK